MDRGNTKQEILEASLDLFSVQGFEATSISQIASAVGIRKASLYSHFENKQAILDAIVKDVLDQYAQRSIFAKAHWDQYEDAGKKTALTPDAVAQMILGQIRYILHDPHISKARKMLVVEQFRNPELAKLQTKQNYTDVLRYFT
ncbi:MAG: TetR/AcrR family transcriptional regulator, partial [Faecousia sp.]